MNKSAILLPLISALLMGCDKKHSISSVIAQATGQTQALASHRTILVMGQSNAVRLNPNGYKGWNTARNSSDTFINCAENGTTMAQWDPNGSRMAKCYSMTQGVKIDAIVWYQGESDANPSIGGSASDYAQKLTTLFSLWRSKWGNVPIVYAQIANVDIKNLTGFVNWQEVKDQQASIFYPNSVMIKTDDITIGNPLSNDGIHFDDSGDYEVGARLARAYMTMGLN